LVWFGCGCDLGRLAEDYDNGRWDVITLSLTLGKQKWTLATTTSINGEKERFGMGERENQSERWEEVVYTAERAQQCGSESSLDEDQTRHSKREPLETTNEMGHCSALHNISVTFSTIHKQKSKVE
jgi:hypothetical protein